MKRSTVFKMEDLLFFHLFCPLFVKCKRDFLSFAKELTEKVRVCYN